ncbi:MAG: 4-carboxy-2-hydroxymuconate-6-semialdehyde dehydrogenase [Lentisphaerae bacterium ADurb.BinA184]|nr:MAG: 4-carboxy-2-hydroxymuconate-6-semialdehyde dehydrogenase [Lentisphaerae bacterium ADurb.BinA184]
MKFVQVGVGGFGRHWVNILKDTGGVEVVGMVDVNEAALEQACQASGRGRDICFHTLEEALSKVEADAVLCSTPPAVHEHDVVTALKAGHHVISEKPMSDSMPACKRMLKAAVATGRTYCVSQNYRYSPPMATLAEVVRSGRLGPVGQVKLDFFMGVDFGGGFRHDMEYPLVIDMSIHHFDLVRFVTGLNPVSVRGAAWNPPWSNYKGDCSSTALFEMDNGARVLYNASWCAKGQFSDWNGNWQIECEKGTLVYQRGEIKLLNVPQLYKVESEEVVRHITLPWTGQHFVLHDFMAAVSEGRRPRTDVFDNIHSVGMVFATVAAMRSGRTASVLDAETRRLVAKAGG